MNSDSNSVGTMESARSRLSSMNSTSTMEPNGYINNTLNSTTEPNYTTMNTNVSNINSTNIQNVFEPNINYVEYEKNIQIDETRKQLKRLFAKRGQTKNLDVILEILLNGTTNSNAYPLPFQGFMDEQYSVSKKIGEYRIDNSELNTICRDVNRSFALDYGLNDYLNNQNTSKSFTTKCQDRYPVLKDERTIHSQIISTLMNRLESNIYQTLDNSMYEYYQNSSKYMGLFLLSTKNDIYAQQLFLQTNRDIMQYMISRDMFNYIIPNVISSLFKLLCEKKKIPLNMEDPIDLTILSKDLTESIITLYVGPTNNYILSQIFADLLLRTHPLFSLYITVALTLKYKKENIEEEVPNRLIDLLIKDQLNYCGKPDFVLDLSKSILKQRSELRLFEKDSPFRKMLETALRMYAEYPPEELLKSYTNKDLQSLWPDLFCDTVGGSHVSYNPSNEVIRIYTNMDLDHYDRNFLYIQLEIPGAEPSLRPFKGGLKTLAAHFQRNEVVDLHPQIAILMYFIHDKSNDLRSILKSAFGGMYSPDIFVDKNLKGCLHARVLDQYRMGYFILCHAIRNGLYTDTPIPNFYSMTDEDKYSYFKFYLSTNSRFFEIEQNMDLIRWARDQPRRNPLREFYECKTSTSKEHYRPLHTANQFLSFYKDSISPIKGGRFTRRKRSLRNNENNFSTFVNARGNNNEEDINYSTFENARNDGLYRQTENVNLTRKNRNSYSVYTPLQTSTPPLTPIEPSIQYMNNRPIHRNTSSIISNLGVRNASKNVEKLIYVPYNRSKYLNTTRRRIKKQFAPVRSTRYRRRLRK